jgi:hypothetical protein
MKLMPPPNEDESGKFSEDENPDHQPWVRPAADAGVSIAGVVGAASAKVLVGLLPR